MNQLKDNHKTCLGNPRWELPNKQCKHHDNYEVVDCPNKKGSVCTQIGLGTNDITLIANKLEDRLTIECASIHMPSGQLYCPGNHNFSNDTPCAYASFNIDEKFGVPRCTYELLRKLEDNLGDC